MKTKPLKWITYYSRKKKIKLWKKKSTEAAILFLFLTRLKREKQFKASSGLDKKEKRGPQKSPLPGRTQTFPGVLINSNLIRKSQQEMSKAALFHKLCWVWDIYIATASRWENTKPFYIGNHL